MIVAYSAPTRHPCLKVVENNYCASKRGMPRLPRSITRFSLPQLVKCDWNLCYFLVVFRGLQSRNKHHEDEEDKLESL